MADVTGPISTMPGHRSAPPDDVECDNHPGVAATHRIQGETDSMGSEQHDLCDACKAKFRAHALEERNGWCDWCKSEANDLRDRRDFEEGMCGRIYRVCGACVRKENEALKDERDSVFGDDWFDDNEE